MAAGDVDDALAEGGHCGFVGGHITGKQTGTVAKRGQTDEQPVGLPGLLGPVLMVLLQCRRLLLQCLRLRRRLLLQCRRLLL